jgi:hypothetical protein
MVTNNTGVSSMSNFCDCDEVQEEHEHCIGCDCVLNWNEGENYCRWCEERMAKEEKELVA